MKNSSDYGNGPPLENESGFDNQPRTPTGYPESSSYQTRQNSTDFQQTLVKLEPRSPKNYPHTQHIQSPSESFYHDGFQSGNNSQYTFMPYNQENNINKLNIPSSSFRHHPYDRPNSQQSSSVYLQNPTPSPSPKQCEKCGFICESVGQLSEHINSCHPSTPIGSTTNFQNYSMLSGGEVIKKEPQSEILDLDSYKVHQILPEERNVHQDLQQTAMMQHQWNQSMENNVQPSMFSPTEQRMYVSQDMNNMRDQRMFSPNQQISNFASNQENATYAQQEFNSEPAPAVSNESPSPAKGASWKSNEPRKPKTYNCSACNKWFTSSGHLKRHYNTTLHKNAVKTSGQPDPANLPISVHHHPKGEQNRVFDKQLPSHNPTDEVERPRSSNEQYNIPIMPPTNQGINQDNFPGSPNVQADPSVIESRGLLSFNNHMPINTITTHNTFNNTTNNGFPPHMLMPVEYYQMSPNGNTPHGSPVIIINDPTTITNESLKFSQLTSANDNSQPLPSFSQIQRFGQITYYGDVGGNNQESIAYSHYNMPQFNTPQPLSYHDQEEDDRKYTMIAPPDSTSTDGDLLPITPSVNNNNVIMDSEGPIVPDIKYDVHCSSPETSNGTPDIENSNPQISSTSSIVKPQPLHKCFDCDKIFNKSCYLTQHNKTFHSGDKPFKCVRCGKRFSCEQQHLEHQAKHGGDKPHKCDQCPKQFNHKTDLRRHMCLHTGKKPFICDLCGKGFIRKDHMIKHGETHLKKPSKSSMMNNGIHARNH